MTKDPAPRIELPNGIVLSERTTEQFMWGGRSRAIDWLHRLPEVLVEWCDRWHVTLEPEIPELNYNVVLFGTTPEYGPVVIKTAPPHEEVTAEVEGLLISQKPGVVRVIAADSGVSIMLQERVVPGTPLRDLTDNGEMSDLEATTLAANMMQTYWTGSPKNGNLISLDRWFESLYAYHYQYRNGGGPIPRDLVSLAIRHADDLLATEQEKVTLHGDLHHQNILCDEQKGWTIIDPKGIVGERGYDIGTWMLNPPGLHAWPNLAGVLDTRLDCFEELLEIDRYRLWQWSLVHSVLSECWTVDGATIDQLRSTVISRALTKLPEAAD